MIMNTLAKNIILSPFNLLYKISPEIELKIMFYLKQRYKLDLDKPVTFSQKIQWIKLYDQNELMPKCCDKLWARKYVEEQGCGELLTKLLWEGEDPEKIPFDKLPEKFVIKVTHGSTFNIICKDRDSLDKEAAKEKCRKWLKAKFIPAYGEWFYGVEKPRIIVEEFLESDDGEELRDYKILCFNGKPAYVRVDSDRFVGHKTDMYDINWVRQEGVRWKYPNSDSAIPKPECFDKVLAYASKLSASFTHARVDFYIVKGKIYFGEVTFTSAAGFDKFTPYEFDLKLGQLLTLPEKKNVRKDLHRKR